MRVPARKSGRETPGDGRDETEAERLDRNYGELLQELRVAQTGVQILFAFLLGIAFQQRFTTIDHVQRVLYLITLSSAAAAAVLLIAPVAVHRVLFRRNRKDEIVAFTSLLASTGLVCLAVAILSAVVLVVDFVSSATVALSITISLGVVVVTSWLIVPIMLRRRSED